MSLICSPGEVLDEFARTLSVKCYPIRMERNPSPLRDIISLFQLVRVFRKHRFDIVHSSTPKAGLLTAIAGFLTRIPIRIHTYTGQVWMGRHDLRGKIFKRCDWIIGKLITKCYADSKSQKLFLTSQGIVPENKILVLGPGSVGGVDLNRFDPAKYDAESCIKIRRELGVAESSLVIIFVGRLTGDKGIGELVGAFKKLIQSYPKLELILIGPLEPERDPLKAETIAEISTNPKIHSIGFSPSPEKYLAAADIFCIPSYREGFGSVAIEAGAMTLPTVATKVIGLVDAVVEGETGFLVPPKDTQALAGALLKLITASDLRKKIL